MKKISKNEGQRCTNGGSNVFVAEPKIGIKN